MSVQVYVVIMHCLLLLCISTISMNHSRHLRKWCFMFFQLQAKQHHCAGSLDMLAMHAL